MFGCLFVVCVSVFSVLRSAKSPPPCYLDIWRERWNRPLGKYKGVGARAPIIIQGWTDLRARGSGLRAMSSCVLTRIPSLAWADLRVQGSGLGAQDAGLRSQASGLEAHGAGLRAQAVELGAVSAGCRATRWGRWVRSWIH